MKKISFLTVVIAFSISSIAQISKKLSDLKTTIPSSKTVPPVVLQEKKTDKYSKLNYTSSPVKIFSLINNYSKKIGNTTLSISKKSADSKAKSSEAKILSATNNQVDPSDNHRVCRTETRRYTAESMTQEILTPEAVNNLKLGGVYNLEKMQSGNYNAIYTNRLPINISLDQAVNVITVNEPDETSLNTALNTVKAIPFAATPTSFGSFLSTQEVTSEESLNATACLSYSGFGFNAADKFHYNKSSTSHKFLLSYINPTYTAIAVPANKEKLLFSDDALNNNQSLVYISQITYGIKLMVYFEGNINSEDIYNKIEAGGYGAKGSLENEYKQRLANTNFTIFLYGSNESLRTVKGYDDMIAACDELLKNISIKGKRIPLELGQPLSYQLRFMDGDIAATSCKVDDIPQQICGPNPNMPLDLEISLTDYTHGGYGVDGNIKAALRIGDNEFWNSTLYTVPSQARVGSREDNTKSTAVATIKIPTVSKEARDNGVLRLYGIWNSNGDVYMSGVNLTPAPATGGFYKNVFFKDIPLKDIIAGSPGNPYKTNLEFRETYHQTATFFIPTITARYIY